jgi:hypothetical protein
METAEQWLPMLLLSLGFLAVFYFLDWASDWQILVDRYGIKEIPSVSWWYVQRGRITCSEPTTIYETNKVGYTVSATMDGFYIRKGWTLAWINSILFIPWTDIVEVEKYYNGERNYYIFRIVMPEDIFIALPQLPFSEVTSAFEKKIKVRVWNKI